jgi:hypothetical protein
MCAAGRLDLGTNGITSLSMHSIPWWNNLLQEFSASPPVVLTDPVQIKQNVTNNVARSMPECFTLPKQQEVMTQPI